MENNSSLAKVQQAYQSFASGNLQSLFATISDDVVWISHHNPASPFYGGHTGLESFEEYFSMMANDDIREVKAHTAIESGNKSIVLIDIKSSENYVHVLRCEAGRIVRIDIYNNSAVA